MFFFLLIMSFKLIYLKDGRDFVSPSGETYIYENYKEATWSCDIHTDIVGPLVVSRIPECEIPPLFIYFPKSKYIDD